MTRPFEKNLDAVSSADTRCRLDVASELVRELSTLTAAGQRFAMAKIVGVLRVPVPHNPLATDQTNRPVGPWMDDLTQQSARVAPDVEVFSRRAMDIVALLRASINPARD
jgi:hypothetical protein